MGLRNERALARMTALHFKGLDPNKLLEWPKEPEEEATLEACLACSKAWVRRKSNGITQPWLIDDRPASAYGWAGGWREQG
jgi:hypothetical protein